MGSVATYATNFAAQVVAMGIQVSYAARVARAEQETYNDRTAMVDTIAKQVQDRADEKQALWRNSYKDCEIAYIREVCAGEPAPISYGDIRQKLDLAYRPAYRRNVTAARECLTESCAPTPCTAVRSLNVHQVMATAWGLEGALRAGEDEHRLQVAQANERKAWVINSGNGYFGNTAGGSMAAAAIYARLANNAGDSANGALAFLGASLRGLTTAVQPTPERRPAVVPRPDSSTRTTPPPFVGPIDQPAESGADPYDARLAKYPVQASAPAVPAEPDPYDNRFPRYIQTEEAEPNLGGTQPARTEWGQFYEPEVPK